MMRIDKNRGRCTTPADLFHSRNARIRHHPIGNEMSLEQSLGKTERLRACKKQLLRLLNFFLSLRVELVHSVELSKKGRRIVAVGARLSNQVEQLPFENPSVSNPENVDLEPGFEALSSATSLAGPAFGTHAACAGADDFVAAAYRTGDSHEDAAERDHDAVGMAVSIAAVISRARAFDGIGQIICNHVDHLFVAGARQVGYGPVQRFLFDFDNF